MSSTNFVAPAEPVAAPTKPHLAPRAVLSHFRAGSMAVRMMTAKAKAKSAVLPQVLPTAHRLRSANHPASTPLIPCPSRPLGPLALAFSVGCAAVTDV